MQSVQSVQLTQDLLPRPEVEIGDMVTEETI